MTVYLDYNASAPVADEVIETVIETMRKSVGNADSRTHEYGISAQKVVQNAREEVAELFGVKPNQVIFTSGATESNNLAIQGLKEYSNKTGKKHIISSTIEHKSVLETVKAMEKDGFEIDLVSPDQTGKISTESVMNLIRPDTLLVALMHVNNETGIIQPASEIGKLLKDQDVLFLVDATQSAGKLISEIQNMDYDFMSFSSHKLQGPQGIGALIVKRKQILKPILYGGHQEQRLRPGTTPVALTAGLGKACELALKNNQENLEKLSALKKLVLSELEASGVDYQINGDQSSALNSTVNVSFRDVSSEALMIMVKNYCAISNGSACTSDEYSLSYVLEAMDLPKNQVEEAVRISWGPDTEPKELQESIRRITEAARSLQ